jgi:hypothetical protein
MTLRGLFSRRHDDFPGLTGVHTPSVAQLEPSRLRDAIHDVDALKRENGANGVDRCAQGGHHNFRQQAHRLGISDEQLLEIAMVRTRPLLPLLAQAGIGLSPAGAAVVHQLFVSAWTDGVEVMACHDRGSR